MSKEAIALSIIEKEIESNKTQSMLIMRAVVNSKEFEECIHGALRIDHPIAAVKYNSMFNRILHGMAEKVYQYRLDNL